MKPYYTSILIISDIEGSSGCWNRKASIVRTKEWAEACIDMSLDVNAVAAGLFDAGVEYVRIQDFHKSGYNLFPELIDKRVEFFQGYRMSPVPIIGDPGAVKGLIMTGMHSSSGSKGFIAHTVSTRIKDIECNGKPLSEAELISMVLAPYTIVPLFFSGCPVSCKEAEEAIPHIMTYSIDKNIKLKDFDKKGWRDGLKKAAAASINNNEAVPLVREGPFTVVLTMRDGVKAAGKIEKRWHLPSRGDRVMIESDNALSLFQSLIKIIYLPPLLYKILPLVLPLINASGKLGQHKARQYVKKSGKFQL